MEERPTQLLPTTVVSPPAQYPTISRFEDVKQDGWGVHIGFNQNAKGSGPVYRPEANRSTPGRDA